MTISNGAEASKSLDVKKLYVEERYYPFKIRTFMIVAYKCSDKYLYMQGQDGTMKAIPLSEVNDFWTD